jgi:hypothetical protein
VSLSSPAAAPFRPCIRIAVAAAAPGPHLGPAG